MKNYFLLLIILLIISSSTNAVNPNSPEEKYKAVQTKLKTGWGTFNPIEQRNDLSTNR